MQDDRRRHKHLRRLERLYYRGASYVHWTLTIRDRRTGWLTDLFFGRFRELLTHSLFRYSIACPIFCLMPDHMHLLWIGIDNRSDQLNAMRHFRRNLGSDLHKIGFELQRPPYDHVLKGKETTEDAMRSLVEYIARNPERAKLVPPDHYREYPYTAAVIPGYPSIVLWEEGYWQKFWTAYNSMRRHGMLRLYERDP